MLIRNSFVFEMNPVPTDAQLKNGYIVTVTKILGANEAPVLYSLNQSGLITP